MLTYNDLVYAGISNVIGAGIFVIIGYVYKFAIWQGETWQGVLDLYTIALNHAYKDHVSRMSIMGTPKKKDTDKELQDLKKAAWYLERKINNLEKK